MSSHPIQPLELDANGILRFKENKIIRFLMNRAGVNHNNIAATPFSQEDRAQFAQLTGDSLQFFIDQGFDREISEAARIVYETGATEEKARLTSLREQLDSAREKIREAVELLQEVPE